MQHFASHSTQAQPGAGRWLAHLALIGCLLAGLPGLLQAQTVYRIVGPDGKVTFSDKPPAATDKASEIETPARRPDASGALLPYALREVVSKYPVTLYTSKDCAPCDSGRSLLRGRGVPFAEKTVNTNDDIESLQRLSGGASLPFLTLGTQQIKGFSEAEWTQYLGAAGYPEQSLLNPGFRNPPPTPLAQVQAAVAAPAKASEANSNPAPALPPPPRVSPANPAGIQF
jgi:glutaredoxin